MSRRLSLAITSEITPACGAALFIYDNSKAVVRKNLFYDNASVHIIVWLWPKSPYSVSFENITVYGGEIGLIDWSPTSVIRNNIITGCTD